MHKKNQDYEDRLSKCAHEIMRLQSELSHCKVQNEELEFQVSTFEFLKRQQEFEYP
jgi:hypothetical protein